MSEISTPILQSGYSGFLAEHSTGIVLNKNGSYKANKEDYFFIFKDLQTAREFGIHKTCEKNVEFVIFDNCGKYKELIVKGVIYQKGQELMSLGD
jgi:hypothetical protein